MRESSPRYRVVRSLGGVSYTEVSLVRSSPGPRHRLHREPEDTLVLHHRAFRPLLELADLEAYAGQLESAADHGNDGTLWHFVTTVARRDGTVDVSLYDRWFDGQLLRCERRAHQEFDATAETSLVASAEFAAGLRVWAAERNQEREELVREENAGELERDRRAAEAATSAAELAAILASVDHRG